MCCIRLSRAHPYAFPSNGQKCTHQTDKGYTLSGSIVGDTVKRPSPVTDKMPNSTGTIRFLTAGRSRRFSVSKCTFDGDRFRNTIRVAFRGFRDNFLRFAQKFRPRLRRYERYRRPPSRFVVAEEKKHDPHELYLFKIDRQDYIRFPVRSYGNYAASQYKSCRDVRLIKTSSGAGIRRRLTIRRNRFVPRRITISGGTRNATRGGPRLIYIYHHVIVKYRRPITFGYFSIKNTIQT